jgi:hypothetical protein
MKYFLSLYLLLFVACTTQIKIISDYNSEGFVITKLKGATIRLYASSTIDVQQLKDDFDKMYPSKPMFDSIITNQIKNNLSKYATISITTNEDMENIFSIKSFSDDRIKKVKEIFENATEDYFVGIKKVTITMITSTTSPKTVSTGTGNMAFDGKYEEDCAVKITTEIWSVKEKMKVAEFTSIGRSSVFLLAYGGAIHKALNYSLTHLTNYIEGNKLN